MFFEKNKKTLGEEIDRDISSVIIKITLSLFTYCRGKKEDSLCNF